MFQKLNVQSNSGTIIPDISDVLESVNRQMLLIFKTNELIRGIESSLKTQNRMTAFWVMSKCCVRSSYMERKAETLKSSKSLYYLLQVREQWEILKLNVFYVCLGIWNFGLIDAVKQIMSQMKDEAQSYAIGLKFWSFLILSLWGRLLIVKYIIFKIKIVKLKIFKLFAFNHFTGS